MLALTASGHYHAIGPAMRGYGDSETLTVDATRGVRDYSDDLASFVQVLGVPPFHLLGWSLGGNIAIQYAIEHPSAIRSLTLESVGSPFGFGGSKGVEGSLTWPDAAGSRGGTAKACFGQRLAQGDRGTDQTSPRTT